MIYLFLHLLTSFFYNSNVCTPAEEINENYRIFNEGSYCMLIQVDTTMHWYGIYRINNVDSFVEIKLQPIKPWENGNMTWSKIATDRSETSQALFIIGSKKALKNKVVSRHEMYKTQFLYPGMSYTVYGLDENSQFTNSKVLSVTGNVKNVFHFPLIENYSLKISDFPSYENPQELNQYFESPGESGMFQILWFGDLDDDRKPDLILQSTSNSNETILLLSTEAKGAKHVEKVASIVTGSCC